MILEVKDTGSASHARHGDDLVCLCGDYVAILSTAYGFRAECRGCRIRWTTINGEPWVRETYSPLVDNCHPPKPQT